MTLSIPKVSALDGHSGFVKAAPRRYRQARLALTALASLILRVLTSTSTDLAAEVPRVVPRVRRPLIGCPRAELLQARY